MNKPPHMSSNLQGQLSGSKPKGSSAQVKMQNAAASAALNRDHAGTFSQRQKAVKGVDGSIWKG